MISDTVLLALIVAAPAVVTGAIVPVIVLAITNRNNRTVKAQEVVAARAEKDREAAVRRAEKQEDWARLDAVAAAAKTDSWQLLESQRVMAGKADEASAGVVEVARVLAETTRASSLAIEKTQGQLTVIHTLVNSNMTAAMESELGALVRELALMREVVELKKVAGHAPTIETLAAIKATESKIIELTASIRDRKAASDQADAADDTNAMASKDTRPL